MKTSQLNITILKCPYAQFENDPQVRDFYQQVVSTKLRGYKSKYGFGVLPVDTTDLFSDHLLLCKGKQVIAGLKSFHYHLAKIFQVEFTPVAFLKKFNNDTHLRELQSILTKCETSNKKIEYSGSFTVDPRFKGDREDMKQLFEMMTAVIAYYFETENIAESIAIGLPRYKTDRVLMNMGYSPLKSQGNSLPDIDLPNFGDQKATVLHLDTFSQPVHDLKEKFRHQWQTRTEIGQTAPFHNQLVA